MIDIDGDLDIMRTDEKVKDNKEEEKVSQSKP